jgi:hypothetical protein
MLNCVSKSDEEYFEKTKDFIFQTLILANEAGGHGLPTV